MNTTIITAEIPTNDVPLFEALLKKFKAKSVKIEKVEDDTKMTKEAYFEMIDRARKAPSRRMTREERKAFLGL